jgi:hypothetical protein
MVVWLMNNELEIIFEANGSQNRQFLSRDLELLSTKEY